MNQSIQSNPSKSRWGVGAALRVFALAFITVLFSGCGRDEATVTIVPKQNGNVPMASLPPGHPETGATMPAGMDMGMGSRPRMSYEVPAGWSESPASAMRVASFKIEKDGKQADFSVIPLAGQAGGEAANVNRWRGQAGLGPLEEADLKKTAEAVKVAGDAAELYDISGTNPGSGDSMRILCVIQHRDGLAWFYKLSGDADLVASQKPALLAFLKSVEFQAPANARAGTLPASHPPIEGMSMGTAPVTSGPISRDGQPQWSVPAG